ncbi:hypothetical protein V1522DRAFT_430993 [Lipomyces starkeyi]
MIILSLLLVRSKLCLAQPQSFSFSVRAQCWAARGSSLFAPASRRLKEDSTTDQVNISSGLSDPDSVIGVFSKVKALLVLPSVVIYNASAATRNDAKNPLNRDLNINTIRAFVAAQQAVLGFEQLPESASKTFIYTGNILNTTTMAPLMGLGVGKSVTAHIIQSAATAYIDRGFKFYYADERKADGSAAYVDINGEAHGKLYVQLAEGKSQGPW